VRVAANDTLDLEVANDLGTDIVVAPDPNWQWMSIERVTEVTAATTSAAFSSPSGQFVQVPYDTASINDGSLYDTTAHQLKAAAAGDFQVCASLAFDSATLEGEIDLFLNTTREKSISNGVGIMSGCRSVRVAANDLIDVRVFQNTTSETIPTDDQRRLGRHPEGADLAVGQRDQRLHDDVARVHGSAVLDGRVR